MPKIRTTPDQLTDAQRRLYDALARGPRAAESAFPLTDENGALVGPFDAMLLAPVVGDAVQAVGAALRFSGELSDRAREIAILLVGRHFASDFEVSAHEAVGRRIGLSDDDLSDVADGQAPRSSDSAERLVTEIVVRLLTYQDLDAALYERAARELGESVIFELTTLVGYYSLLAVQLRVFG
jgi:4-carboxymuconolactone decarboxylase